LICISENGHRVFLDGCVQSCRRAGVVYGMDGLAGELNGLVPLSPVQSRLYACFNLYWSSPTAAVRGCCYRPPNPLRMTCLVNPDN
jgi:hypothetical protein